VNENEAQLEAAKEEIAREIERVHGESYGESAHNIEVSIEERFVTVMMDISLSPAEETLIEAGNVDSVKGTREGFQEAIAPIFMAIVERATGSRVAGFASQTVLKATPPWSVEVFRLQPSEA